MCRSVFDEAASRLAVHFLRTAPPTMIARRDDRLSLMVQQRSASGARYEGSSGSFWEKGGEAMVTWGAGQPEMRCTVSP